MVFKWNFRKLFPSINLEFVETGGNTNQNHGQYTAQCCMLSWWIDITPGVQLFSSKADTRHSIRIHIYCSIVYRMISADIVHANWNTVPPEFLHVKWASIFCVLHSIVRCVVFYIANLYIFERLLACTLRICKNILLKMFFSKSTTFSLPIFYHKNWFISGFFYIVY